MISMQVSPSQWNNSLVCLIFKNKGSNQDVKNYRPISLTIVAKRIFEKAIDKKLDAYKSMLHDLQGGFRKGRSTLHQVYYLAELMKSNKLINVFMDFRAAYDTVDRRILWTSLFHTFKFLISLIRTLRSIFEFNESFLLVGSDKSPGIPNLRGVPQGSSLSPTMFNFFINSLIVQLEAELKANGMDTNCLFFADDGNLHSPNPAIIQVLLNVCHKWSFENGMSFAADKCFVIAKDAYEFKLGNSILPQVENTKYLGILFDHNGPVWDSTIEKLAIKAKNASLALMKIGFNKDTWDPSSKVNVLKLFIRSLMEYGMQVNLYSTSQISSLDKVQFMALRIAFGVPWNVSKNALLRISCLESMQCRNRVLNACFMKRLEYLNDNSIPAFKMFKSKRVVNGSLAYSWSRFNPYYIRLKPFDEFPAVKKEIVKIRYENITQDSKGNTRISDAILVPPDLKHSAIMSWNGFEDATIKKELLKWRLGRVVFHQECQVCHNTLTRQNAVICSNVDYELVERFPEVRQSYSNTIIDDILNHFLMKGTSRVWKVLYEAIITIRQSCLLQIIE
jgi:hypothetical protein